MKKLIIGCLSLLVFAFAAQAQEDPARALKKAGNAFKAYQLDPASNMAKLHEAVDLIDVAMAGEEQMNDSGAWKTQGDIYNAIADQIVQVRFAEVGDLASLPQVEEPAYKAMVAYQKALELAEKKYHTKDALKGLRTVQTNLNNLAIYAFEDGSFDAAYENFNGVITAHDLLKGAKMESMLDPSEESEDDPYIEQVYLAGLAALNANKLDAAKPLFMTLKEQNANKAAIYEGLYKIEAAEALDPNSELDEAAQTALLEKAYANLEEGRKRFPDDVSILFAEINHFLRINKLEALISKLETAIEKEPDNLSLYTTLGSVYDNLYQKEAGEGNDEVAAGYFDKALEQYNNALTKDPSFTDATYSIGALYFNRAAKLTEQLTTLADDFSKEGQRKYDELQSKVAAEFENALPYFIEVEKQKPADVNTLIALKEIYARKKDYDTSNEFKARYEKAIDPNNTEEMESYFLKN
ncbi:MAG: tetratricopeptide repeat protein [Bacteroidota bacterium]